MAIPFGPHLSQEARHLVTRLLESQGYRELVAVDILASAIRLAPTLDDKALLLHQAHEELEHFEALSGLYEKLGGGDLFEVVRHRLSEVPEPSSWLEAVVVESLFCRAGRFHLREHQSPSYAPYADIVKRILAEEEEHLTAADGVLRDLCWDDPANVRSAQVHLERWLRPSVLSFCLPDVALGRRMPELALEARESQAVVRDYLRDVGGLAAACGLRMPALVDLGLDLASNEADGK
jgi:ring-1,2-phenylacetyl-CoA epoxidase subunit PaaA